MKRGHGRDRSDESEWRNFLHHRPEDGLLHAQMRRQGAHFGHELADFLRLDGRDLIISGLSKEVYRVLKNAGMVPVIGRENLFIGSAQNPNLSTRNALKRAQAILGTSQADVRIFYDPGKPSGG